MIILITYASVIKQIICIIYIQPCNHRLCYDIKVGVILHKISKNFTIINQILGTEDEKKWYEE